MTRCMSASSGPLSGNRCMSGNCSPMRPTGPKLWQNLHLCQRPPEIFTFGSCLIPRGVSPTAMRWRSTLAGASPNADWSVISVLDRIAMMDGGVEECIATYRFHLDQDLTVWRAVQVAGMVLSCAAGRRSE